MKLVFISIIFLITTIGYSQSKYFIYFKDKVIDSATVLKKGTDVYNSALSLLSQKSIERRLKNMSEEEIITYEDLPINEDYILQVEKLGIKVENKLRWFNAVTAYLSEDEKTKVASLQFVEKIETVRKYVFKSPEIKEEPVLSKQSSSQFSFDYGPSLGQLQLSEVPAVHSKGITGEGVLLGLLDTGFNWKNHESLKDATIVAEYDFIFKDTSTENDSLDNPNQHNHGTLVFSIVGGFKEGSLIGSAFCADFILAKTEDIRSEKHIEEDNYAAALEWMESYGVDITSSSLGYSTFDPPEFSYTYEDMDGKTTIVTKAAELAFRRGIVTITSAGNEGASPWHYITAPADGINTLAIGAVNNTNEVAGFSSRGPSYDGRIKPDLVAQGVSVYCSNPGNFSGYISASGTSVSAPIASGIAALLLSAYPHLKNTQIRNILIETAGNSSSPNNDRGYGLISAVRAVEFPNLQTDNGTYKLNKIFLTNDNIFPSTVYIHYSANGGDYTEAQLGFGGSLKYNFRFPYLFNNDLVEFYFTYDDNTGASYREPVSGNYKFFYGSLDVSLNLSPQQTYSDYIVSEPYPNPFHPLQSTFTSVLIKSSGNENLTIRIIDPIGQQVGFYSTVTTDGENRFDWFGKNAEGVSLSSGAYYFLIDLNGKLYSRNLVLLR